MKRVRSLFLLLGMVGLIASVALLQSGCEEAKGLDGLQLDPASKTLTTNDQTVVFTVTGGITNEALALPLTWSVQDGSLGRITHSSGYTAIYQRSGNDGVNTVMARDQYENEGYATVEQTSENYSLTLEASASSVLVNEAVTITVTTESAQAPFSWQLVSDTTGNGSVSGSGASAGFSSSAVGVAVIQATDANGASGVIAITVSEAVDTDGGSGGPGGS